MAVTMTKAKAETKAKGKAKSETAALVDEYSKLAAQIEKAGLALVLKRTGEIEKKLRAIAEDKPAAEEVTFRGEETKTVIQFSARSMKKDFVDNAKLKTLIGTKLFNEIANIPVGELSKYFSEEEMKEKGMCTETQTGSRRISVIKG